MTADLGADPKSRVFLLGKPLTASWPEGSQLFTSGQPGPSIGKGLNALRPHVSGGNRSREEWAILCPHLYSSY